MKIYFSKSTMYYVLTIFVLAFKILRYFKFTCAIHRKFICISHPNVLHGVCV